MKLTNYISIIALIFSTNFSAQVGINTNGPKRTLDINGNLRLQKTDYKGIDDTYNKVLVTDSNGNVEFWDKNDVKSQFVTQNVETKKMYLASSPDGNRIVTCGQVRLKFNSSTQPEISLTKVSTSSTTIYMTRSRMYATNNRNTFGNFPITIPPSNAWQRIDQTGGTGNGSSYTINTKDEYFFGYPGSNNFYRVSFLARSLGTTNSYSMICEKF